MGCMADVPKVCQDYAKHPLTRVDVPVKTKTCEKPGSRGWSRYSSESLQPGEFYEGGQFYPSSSGKCRNHHDRICPTCAGMRPTSTISTLAAIVRHESARQSILQSGSNGGVRLPRQPRNKSEAVATAEWLKTNGYDFDAGVGQINVRNLGWLGMSIGDLFDPAQI